jgi:Mn2+/Fe2+ NRAMP family transporter
MPGLRVLWTRLKEHPLARVGPGLITGVADDDPSGIATYSQAGAQFGLNMLWTMPLAFPLMAAIQSICARIGRVTGKGLAANMKVAFPGWVLKSVVTLLLVANTLNIAADLAAMGEVAELVSGINRHLMTVCFVMGTLLLQVFIPYHRYVFFLKWLTLCLLAYAAVLFTVHVPWGQVALRTVWPQFKWNSAAATVVVGIFGTTISPYLFFWQASEEIEEMHKGLDVGAPYQVISAWQGAELRRIGWDTWSGMFYSDITAYFIILATAVTLNRAGITDITTAAQAASALRPARRPVRLPAVRIGHSRRRIYRRASTGWLRCLRFVRGRGLELGSGTTGDRCARILRGHRSQCARGARDPVHTDQSDESVILERGHQRHRGRAAHGGDHAPGLETNP